MQIQDTERRKNLASFLKQERKNRGWSQRDLARYLEATQNAVYMWESERSTPDTANFDKLATIFGLNTWELLQKLEPRSGTSKQEKLDINHFLNAFDTMTKSEILLIVNTGVQKLAQAS